MWITNVSKNDIEQGNHEDAGDNAMVIRIMDPGAYYGFTKKQFKEEYVFLFLDIEDQNHPWSFSEEEAKRLSKLLKHAYDNKMNVVVHCMLGSSRSGAVVEVGIEMGFEDRGKTRSPNNLVKSLIKKELGLPYDLNEKNYTVFCSDHDPNKLTYDEN